MGLLIGVVRYIPLAAVFLLAAATFSLFPPSVPAVRAQDEGASSSIPRRIISLGPINTENVFLLGAGDRLVADTVYCVRPEAARDLTKVGSLLEINIEKIISLRPDVVLATALTQPGDIKRLHQLGIRVVQFEKPASFMMICEQFLRLGRLLGCEESAHAVIDGVRERVRCVEQAVSKLPPQKVFLQVGATPLFASVPGSFTSDYIRLSNGINIVGDQKSGTTGVEKVLALDPDVIIIAIMGSETGIAAQEKQRWMRFNAISAVRKGRVHTVNPDVICSPSPATFAEALEEIAVLVHPEAAAKIRECGR